MSDTPRTDAAWLKRADSPRRQCSEQLERELAAYQAEMPEAPEVYGFDGNDNDFVLAYVYDALAKRCARLTAALKKLGRRSHYYCEDSWYSCPKAEDGCA